MGQAINPREHNGGALVLSGAFANAIRAAHAALWTNLLPLLIGQRHVQAKLRIWHPAIVASKSLTHRSVLVMKAGCKTPVAELSVATSLVMRASAAGSHHLTHASASR